MTFASQSQPAGLRLHQRLLALADPKTDAEALHRHFMFIREHDLDVSISQQGEKHAWAVRLARKYYDRLNKTYVIVDLSRYHKHQVGMRWRTPKEVSRGTGQFICAAVGCEAARHLTSLEVPFSYKEHAVLKHALVKARLCPVCTQKLLAASPRGSKGGLRSGDSSRVQAVLKAAAASSTHTVQDSATMHTGGAAIGARKRARAASSATGDEGVGNQGGGNSLQQGGSHKTRRASSDRTSPEELRNTRSPSAASAASVASRGAASVGSAAVNGLSDEALLRRLLR